VRRGEDGGTLLGCQDPQDAATTIGERTGSATIWHGDRNASDAGEGPAVTARVDPSRNGRGSPAWSGPWTGLRVDRRSLGYCRVTFDHPPINTITATTVAELSELVDLIEADSDLNVVVFDSANTDHYLAHYDAEGDPSRTAALPPGPTGMHPWIDLLVRLSRAPVVSIAAVRGRTRGAGSEFILACDLRFASRENALLGQFEVATGVVPGSVSMTRLARLVGRGRALEILLVAHDFDGPRAEQYGYVNRAIADDRLDVEIDEIASRLALFDHDAIAQTKSYVDEVTLPSISDLQRLVGRRLGDVLPDE
jgi:enoyl-CoA hydratase/carnithine racemase